MKLNESSVSNETSIKETKRCFAVLFNLWKPNGKLQNQWLHPDQSNQCCTFSLSFLFVCGACSWLKNWQNLGTIWNFLRKCLLQCEKRYGRIQCCLASEKNFDFVHAFPMFLHLCLPVELLQWPWDCFCSRFESLKKFFSHCPVGIIQKGSRCVGSNTDADKESVL